MRQKKISGWLVALCIVLAIIGILVFGGLTILKLRYFAYSDATVLWGSLVGGWYTAILCYLTLFQFLKVAIEIGNDNSFSLENANAFHKMGIYGLTAGVGYLVRGVYFTILQNVSWLSWSFYVLMAVLCVIFLVLCEALSKLIQNAFEVKRENELTI